MTAHYTDFCSPVNTSRGIIGRPRIWQPIPETNGYAVHDGDGRVRDRYRHPVTDPAIIAALIPPKSAPMVRLACCSQWVRVDQPTTAAEHWSNCISDMVANPQIPKSPRQYLDSGKVYSRDVYPRRAPRRAVLGEPMVLAHNGRRIRMMPWATAVRIMLQRKGSEEIELSTARYAS